MADKIGVCRICGKMGKYTCILCGKLVCEDDYDKGMRICVICKRGRTIK
jgi:hypothetical protein